MNISTIGLFHYPSNSHYPCWYFSNAESPNQAWKPTKDRGKAC